MRIVTKLPLGRIIYKPPLKKGNKWHTGVNPNTTRRVHLRYVCHEERFPMTPNMHLMHSAAHCLLRIFLWNKICKLSWSYPPKWTIKTTRLHFLQVGHLWLNSIEIDLAYLRETDTTEEKIGPFVTKSNQVTRSLTDLGFCDASGVLCLRFSTFVSSFFRSLQITLTLGPA